MQATTNLKQTTGCYQENVAIFIDYSSVLTEGQRKYPNWLFDVGGLYEILLREFIDENKSVEIQVYGPIPPSTDTIWTAAELDINAIAERETWTKNKMDCEIATDLISIGADAFHRQVSTTFIVVLGDRDLAAPLEKLTKKYCCQVDLWLWGSALLHMRPESERGGSVRVYTLDDYIEDAGRRLNGDPTRISNVEDKVMDWTDGNGVDNCNEANHGFVEVRRRQKESQRMRCRWRECCYYGLACNFVHTKEEEDNFKIRRSRRAEKYRFCRNTECGRGSRCSFAHSKAELFCPTCNKSGAGHEMRHCPERFRYAAKRT